MVMTGGIRTVWYHNRISPHPGGGLGGESRVIWSGDESEKSLKQDPHVFWLLIINAQL